MSTTTITTAFDGSIADYLERQRALGRAYVGEEHILRSLREFICTADNRDVDLASFERWCASHASLTGNVRRNRQRIVRNWCLYRQRTEPLCFVPDPNRFPRPNPHKAPVIIAPVAVGRMLTAARSVKPTPDSALRPDVLRLATVLLYSAGLRRGELIRLQLGDINDESIETTQIYLDANLEMKQAALDRVDPQPGRVGRFRPDDQLLAFLKGL